MYVCGAAREAAVHMLQYDEALFVPRVCSVEEHNARNGRTVPKPILLRFLNTSHLKLKTEKSHADKKHGSGKIMSERIKHVLI